MTRQTDREWRAWGRIAPYFGVLTEPEYRHASLDDAARRAFFATGEALVDHLFATLERLHGPLRPDRTLDYGCGVGRLLLPLASRCTTVVGADISPAMLAEAERNLAQAGATNATLRLAEDLLADDLLADDLLADDADAGYDLIVSMITLQHLEPDHALAVVRNLLRQLRPGGVAALHVTVKDQRSLLRRAFTVVRRRIRLVHHLANLRERKPWSWPYMGVYIHDPLAVRALMLEAGCSEPSVELTDEGGIVGAVFFSGSTDRSSPR